MKNDSVFDPIIYRELIKQQNKGMYKKQQSQDVQNEKIRKAQEKREQKALKKAKK